MVGEQSTVTVTRAGRVTADNARAMNEIKFFRLLLVMLAALVLGAGGGWAYCTHRADEAQQSMDNSFGDYNRYIAACNNAKEGAAWDMATRAYDRLHQATGDHERFQDRADTLMWFGLIVGPALILLFYGLRWAMTGRVRPLWLLGRTRAG